MKVFAATVAACLLASCSAGPDSDQCPDPSTVAPASIGGAGAVQALTAELAGPNRGDSISTAIRNFHQRDPALTPDELANILLAADCPNINGDVATQRRRLGEFRSQVDSILAVPGN